MIVRIPNWLGDAIMATPVYNNLCDKEELYLFGPPSFLNLFEDFPGVTLLPYLKENKKFSLEELKKFKNQKALLLTNSFSSAWLFWRAGFKEIMGYATDGRSLLLTKRIKPPHGKIHQRDYYLYLLEKLGYNIRDRELVLPLREEKIRAAEGFLKALKIELGKSPFIVMAPGAAYGPAKKWPEDYYRALAKKLVKEGFRVLVVGKGEERALGDYIQDNLKEVYNLCGVTEITLLAGILKLSVLLVSNDSGLMHLGAALKLPQIAIFGSTDPLLTGPLNPKAKVLKISIDCSPCFERTCPKGHYHCLKAITPEEVLEEIKNLL